jgi:hypothetical protein
MLNFELISLEQLLSQLGPTAAYIRSVSYKLVFLFFCISIVIEQFKAITEEPKYLHVVLSLFLFFGLIMVYPMVIKSAYSFCSELSSRILSNYEFSDFLDKIQKYMDQDNLSFWDITKGQITKIITFLSFVLISLSINLLLVLRLILLGFIFCVTPLIATMVVFRTGLSIVRTTFTTIVAICLWSVVANIFLKVMYVVIGSLYVEGANILVIISANVIVAMVMFSTPTITYQLVNFESIASTNLAQQAYQKIRDLSMVGTGVAVAKQFAMNKGKEFLGKAMGKISNNNALGNFQKRRRLGRGAKLDRFGQ